MELIAVVDDLGMSHANLEEVSEESTQAFRVGEITTLILRGISMSHGARFLFRSLYKPYRHELIYMPKNPMLFLPCETLNVDAHRCSTSTRSLDRAPVPIVSYLIGVKRDTSIP